MHDNGTTREHLAGEIDFLISINKLSCPSKFVLCWHSKKEYRSTENTGVSFQAERRTQRLFDMERPVVHTRNNYFFKCENRFFHLLTKERLDPYFAHLVMQCIQSKKKEIIAVIHMYIFLFAFFNAIKDLPGYPIPVQGPQEIAF